MVWVIFTKELRETMLDLRFVIVSALCLVIIPLGMFVAGKDYRQHLADFTSARQLAAEGKFASPFLQAEGFRPPSPLSVFATGLAPFMPERAVTYPSQLGGVPYPPGPQLVKEPGLDAPQSLLFGQAGLLFSVTYVVSLAALMLTFNTISGEKESGTLRLMTSNAVPRTHVLVGKVLGAYVALLAPFMLALGVGLLTLHAARLVPVFSAGLAGRVAAIVAATLLFILVMVNLGVLGSALTRHPRSSMVFLLFVWTLLVLAVPRVSPLVAKLLFPVESNEVTALRERVAKENLRVEYLVARNKLYDECLREFGVPLEWRPTYGEQPENPAEQRAYDKYNKEAELLTRRYEQRLGASLDEIRQTQENRRAVQASVATNLSRFSPVACYTYLLSDLSGTGLVELKRFKDRARRFQDEVEESVYSRFVGRSYSSSTGVAVGWNETLDPGRPIEIPTMDDFGNTPLDEAIRASWVDLLVLVSFAIVFFAGAFAAMARYDVR